MTVTNTAALTNAATAPVTVTAAPRAPTAALSVTPASGVAPLAVTADASGSTDPQGQTLSYTFNFGDGTTLPAQPGATATHSYSTAGTYTVTVTVTNTAALSATATAPVISIEAQTLSGVVRAGGVPVGGAGVWVYTLAGVEQMNAATDASGAYRLALAPGSYKLYVSSPVSGYPSQWVGGVDFAGAAVTVFTTTATQDIVLQP